MTKKTKQVMCLCAFFVVMFFSAFNYKPDETTENVCNVEEVETEINVVQNKPVKDLDEVHTKPAVKTSEPIYFTATEEEMLEEDRLGEMEMISQLVQAEAGNQDLIGMRYVAAVVLNRVDSDEFPDTVEEVILQEDQFTVIKNGMFDDAGWHISDDAFKAVWLEYEERSNYDILYFSTKKSRCMSTEAFKYQDHWFGW